MRRHAMITAAIVLCCSFAAPTIDARAQGAAPNGFQQDFRLLVETLAARHPGIPEHPLQILPLHQPHVSVLEARLDGPGAGVARHVGSHHAVLHAVGEVQR